MSGTYTKLRYHFVFTTKGRESLIIPALKEDLHRYMSGIIVRQRGVVLEINGMPDHVHILAGLPPTISVAEIMKRIKGATSHWINEQGHLDRHSHGSPATGRSRLANRRSGRFVDISEIRSSIIRAK